MEDTPSLFPHYRSHALYCTKPPFNTVMRSSLLSGLALLTVKSPLPCLLISLRRWFPRYSRRNCSPFKLMAVLYGACQAIFKSWNQSVTKGPSRYPSMREIRQQQPRGGSLSCKMLKRFSKHRKKPPSIIAQAHASSCSEGLRDMRRPVRPLGTHGAKCATGRNNRTRGTSMAVPWPCPTFKIPATRYICHWGRRRKGLAPLVAGG